MFNLLHGPTLISIHDYWKNHNFDYTDFCTSIVTLIVAKIKLGFPGDSDSKQSACDRGDPVSIPGSERSSGTWKGYPLQYSCLENPMDRRPCWAMSMASQRVRHDWVTNTHTQNKLKMENNPEVVEQVNGYTRVYSLSKRNSSQPEKGTNYWFRKQKWVKCILLNKSYMGCDNFIWHYGKDWNMGWKPHLLLPVTGSGDKVECQWVVGRGKYFCDRFDVCDTYTCVCAQPCPTLCNPLDCSPPGSSVNGNFQ